MKGQKVYSDFVGMGSMSQEELDEHLKKMMAASASTRSLDAEDQVTMRELLVALAKEVGTLNDVAKLPPEEKEGIYGLGYQAYQQGNFEQAVHFFRLLYMLDPLNDRNIFALGLALEKQKKYFEALTAYMACSYLCPDNPISYFRSGVCFTELQEPNSAYQMFLLTQSQAKGKKDFEVVAERAKLFAAGLKSKARDEEKKGKKSKGKKAVAKKALKKKKS